MTKNKTIRGSLLIGILLVSVSHAFSATQTFLLTGEQSEVSSVVQGAKVSPSVGPSGDLVIRGKGTVSFAPVQIGNGVSFGLGGQQTANTAFYQFKGQSVGTVFNNNEGELEVYLKSKYSFAERKLLSRWNNRYIFDVNDGTKTQFGLNAVTNDGSNLIFYYTISGVGGYYYIPKGKEDILYGKDTVLKVKMVWGAGKYTIYLNDTLVKTQSYTPLTPSWSDSSLFLVGASISKPYTPGFFSSDDSIDDFKVFSGSNVTQLTAVTQATTSQTTVVSPITAIVTPVVASSTKINTTQPVAVGTSVIATPVTVISPTVIATTTPKPSTTQSVAVISTPTNVTLVNYKTGIPAYNPNIDVAQAPNGFGTGKLWQVGPTRQYKKPSDVVSLVKSGDVVEIDAATYACDVGLKWAASFLTLRGVGGRPLLDATRCSIPGGKGIWNPMYNMGNLIVDNIEFKGASVADANGAGIRYDGSGYLYITNSYFHNNQNGVLITPNASSADVVIDRSEFARNGAGDGYSHNMYISGNTRSFVLRFSYTHDAHIGHEVKSRAKTNYILYNRIATEKNGDSSYNIDFPNGGLTYVIGNVIHQGAKSPNYSIGAYSGENGPHPIQKIYLAHNTIVNEGIPPKNARVINLYDKGLTEAKMVNNLIVGIDKANLVGNSPSKMTMVNNIITTAPEFFDQANRIYYLKASSTAINSAVETTLDGNMSASPSFEFIFPAGADQRSKVGSYFDVGAYEYRQNQEIIPAPTVTLSVIKNTIEYDSPATLVWETKNATACQAGGAWAGNVAINGTYTTGQLKANQNFTIFCSGKGGSISSSVSVSVNDSPLAVAMGKYSWQEVPNSTINSVGAASLKNASGAFTYANNFGTGPYTESKGGYATGVYVKDTDKWYLMGGGGGRNYYGNEVYAFNFKTMKAEMVTTPTDIGTTKEYTPEDIYGSKIHLTGCQGILNLKNGGIAPAPRGIQGSTAYNPLTKKIVVGPFGIVRGIGNCDGSALGQYATDMWAFDPMTTKWSLIAKEDERLSSTIIAAWFLDPLTGISYAGGARNGKTRGAYLIDGQETKPSIALVDNTWPFNVSSGPISIDTDNRYAFQIGVAPDASKQSTDPRFAVFNLNGLSMTKYGTLGKGGTTGTVGGSGSMFDPDVSWKVTGELEALRTDNAAITYNTKLQKFVIWTGGDIIYFLTPDYKTKTIDILSKRVYGAPTSSNVAHKFSYIPERDLYIAFVGTNKNFFLLKPNP